jgi:hypothetical protein
MDLVHAAGIYILVSFHMIFRQFISVVFSNNLRYTGCGKPLCPNFVRWRGDQNKDLLSKNYCGDKSLHRYGLSNWVWLRLEIKTTEVFFGGGGNCILYQFRADVPTYGHRPRYTADNDAAKTDVHSTMPGCCLNNMGNKILFRINWRCVNQGFKVAPIRRKKSIGVRSCDLGGQAIAPPRPLRRSSWWRWDVLEPVVLEPNNGISFSISGSFSFRNTWLICELSRRGNK